MKKYILFFVLLLFLEPFINPLNAQFISIPVTGFNQDIVANGVATSTASTTASVDGQSNVFLDNTFKPGSSFCATASVWPSNNTINSLNTPGLTYTLQPATSSNALQAAAGSSGTLNLTTPVSVYNLYVLALGGNGACSFNATITFTDATTQLISGLTVPDWCNGTSAATIQFNRTARNTSTSCSVNLCPYMYDVVLPINTANQSKNIASVTFANQTGSGRLNIYAVSGYNILPCASPLNPATDLTLTPYTSTVTASFTASAGNPAADHYLVVRSNSNSLTANPVNGTTYSKGNAIGGGVVVSYKTTTTFIDSNLVSGITYYYYVFAANSNCTGGPVYLTTNPASNHTTLWNGVFTSSDLPIVVINTNNITIPDSPKINAKMGIIYNGEGVRNYLTNPFNNYNNKIGIEVRGSYSQTFPQKQYSIETRDTANLEHDTVVLGMPADNNWILYAPYDDKACLRNTLTFDLANKTGHYASRTKFCELVLNGQYMGIYVWMEKIKRGSDRVDISKLLPTDTVGDELTGGYIFKIDKTTGGSDGWNSNYLTSSGATMRFLYDYPDAVDLHISQKNYIKLVVDSFETALKATNYIDPVNGYRKYMDVNSFIDYFLLSELNKNVDSYRFSTFLYKNKYSHGGKIVIGPMWDYNIAYGNANYNEASITSGWAYQLNQSYTGAVPFWWARLIQDSTFTSGLKCRWTELRQSVLSTQSIFHYIDSIAVKLNEAQVRHFVKWPILGIYVWPNQPPYPTSFAGEITAIKTWIQARINWLDANMTGTLTNPVLNLGNDTLVCPGLFVLNAGNTGSSYQWMNGTTSQTITVNTAGIYSVTVNKNGCKKSDTVVISLKPQPIAFAGNDTSICQGNSIKLTATGGISYIWNNSVLQGVPFVPIYSQNYVVTVTGANGCKSKDSLNVTLITNPPKPIITVKYGLMDTLISNVQLGNQWYKNGNILMGENGSKLIVSPLINAVYSDIVTENGCSSVPSDMITIIVGINDISNNCSFQVFPNPFNEFTIISYSLKLEKHIYISIYDLTGREIKVLINSMQEKGEHNVNFDAATLKAGIYYYHIKAGEDTYTGKIVKIK
ncbi:MAG: CotH kinase family protein [Bacteroidales bacterium]